MTKIEDTLMERGFRYGPFTGHAFVTQRIKEAISPVRDKLSQYVEADMLRQEEADAILECLDMVAHKIGRIVNGDPLYEDSWHDIVGYVTLVENMLKSMRTEV
jgi:hypothetical protein